MPVKELNINTLDLILASRDAHSFWPYYKILNTLQAKFTVFTYHKKSAFIMLLFLLSNIQISNDF